MKQRPVILLFFAAALTLAGPVGAQAPVCGQDPAVQDLKKYIEDNLCSATKPTGCLEPVTINVCASGCPRRGYNWRHSTSSASPPRQEIHLTLRYLKELRNAAVKCRSFNPTDPTTGVNYSFGMTLEELLWNQVEMYLRHPQARYYKKVAETYEPRSVSLVLKEGANTVDPNLFDVVTFVNEGGTAHAMTQSGFGYWLQTVAQEYATWVPPSESLPKISHYLRLSERVFNALGLPDESGGVRNNKEGNLCYNGLYCFWFHSFPVGSYTYPWTVLNQNLHAIRDAMWAHAALASWQQSGYNGVALPPDFDTHIKRLRYLAHGGLYQLAFSLGNQQQAGIYAPPPNLREFLKKEDVVGGVQRYRAYYRYAFHPEELKRDGTNTLDTPGGRDGSSRPNACHYHFHSIQVMATILAMIQGPTSSPHFNIAPVPDTNGQLNFVDVYYKLLYNRNPGDRRTCGDTSVPPSLNVMRGVPLAELYKGSLSKDIMYPDMSFHADCREPDGNYTDARLFNAAAGERGAYEAARDFYDVAYSGCTF